MVPPEYRDYFDEYIKRNSTNRVFLRDFYRKDTATLKVNVSINDLPIVLLFLQICEIIAAKKNYSPHFSLVEAGRSMMVLFVKTVLSLYKRKGLDIEIDDDLLFSDIQKQRLKDVKYSISKSVLIDRLFGDNDASK